MKRKQQRSKARYLKDKEKGTSWAGHARWDHASLPLSFSRMKSRRILIVIWETNVMTIAVSVSKLKCSVLNFMSPEFLYYMLSKSL